MLENNFERELREKMAKLRFEPSDPVWAGVQAQIGEKRKKRRVVFWLFFATLLLGGGATWLALGPQTSGAGTAQNKTFNNISKNAAATAKGTATSFKNGVPAPEASTASGDNTSGSSTAAAPGATPFPIGSTDAAAAGNSPAWVTRGEQLHPGSALIATDAVVALNATVGSTKTSHHRTKTRVPGTQKSGIARARKSPASTPGLAAAPQEASATTDNASPVTTPAAAPETSSAPAVAKTTAAPQKADSTGGAPPPPAPKKGRRAVEWSLSASSGLTMLSGKAGTSASPMVLTTAQPSYKGRMSASFEVTAAIPVSKRISLTAGAGYTYYSADATVHDLIVSTPQQGMLIGTGAGTVTEVENTARFDWHFIQLSTGLRWKPIERIPLVMSGNLTAAQELGGRSWDYQYGTGSFLAARNARPLQLFAGGALEYRVWKSRSKALYLGPRINTALTRTGTDNKYKIGSWGAGLRVQF